MVKKGYIHFIQKTEFDYFYFFLKSQQKNTQYQLLAPVEVKILLYWGSVQEIVTENGNHIAK